MTLKEAYKVRRDAVLEPLAKRLEKLLGEYCKGLSRIDRISARAKGVDRFVDKAQKLEGGKLKYGDPLNEIQDQVGARIVTFYLRDVETVADEVMRYLKPVEKQLLIPEKDSEFGYVGQHFIVLIPNEAKVEDEPEEHLPKFFELQIKTLFQHAWSEGNHDLAYKPIVPMSSRQKRLVALTAAQGWGADQIFDQLFEEMVNMPRVTVETIDQYRGTLTIGPGDLKCDMWDVFDRRLCDEATSPRVVPLKDIVSTKDERTDKKFLAGVKDDPRKVALGHMQNAAAQNGPRRGPITVAAHSDGLFYVLDGNATVQVLMLAKWTEVPISIVS